MFVSITNRKSGKSNNLSFAKTSLTEIQELASRASGMTEKYALSVVAEKEADIDFVFNSFHNIPLPATPKQKAVWNGDLALFLIMNYPAPS